MLNDVIDEDFDSSDDSAGEEEIIDDWLGTVEPEIDTGTKPTNGIGNKQLSSKKSADKVVHKSKYVVENADLYYALCEIEDWEFSEFNDEQQEELMKTIELKGYQPGENIFLEGDTSCDLYLVIASESTAHCAEVEVVTGSASAGTEVFLTRLQRGSYFGQKYFVTKRVRQRSATCRIPKDSPVVVMIGRIDPKYFDQWGSFRNLLLVQNVPLIQMLPRKERMEIIEKIEVREFKDGDYIATQGEMGEYFFIIQDGSVKVVEERPDGVLNHLVTLRQGHFFGEMSIVTDNPRVASVKSYKFTICLCLSKSAFRGALTDETFKNLVHQTLNQRKEIRMQRRAPNDTSDTQTNTTIDPSAPTPLSALSTPNTDHSRSTYTHHGMSTRRLSAFKSIRERTISEVTVSSTLTLRKLDSGNRLINKYVLEKELGKGAFGVVYLCKELETGNSFAMKVINRPTQSWNDEANKMIRQEIAVMKRLKHENIVSLREVIDDPNSRKIYLIQEFMENGPLMPDAEKVEPISQARARKCFRDILKGVCYLHHEGIVHRDLKPQNILLSSDDVAKIADFGAAVFTMSHGDAKEKVSCGGTPAFMAPELLTSSNQDFSKSEGIDIFALGATLFFMVVGTPPWMANNEVELARKINTLELTFPPDEGREEVLDVHLKFLLKDMLCKEHRNRIKLDDILMDQWVTKEDTEPVFEEGNDFSGDRLELILDISSEYDSNETPFTPGSTDLPPTPPPPIVNEVSFPPMLPPPMDGSNSDNSLASLLLPTPPAPVYRTSITKILIVDPSFVTRKMLSYQINSIRISWCGLVSNGNNGVSIVKKSLEPNHSGTFDFIFINAELTQPASLSLSSLSLSLSSASHEDPLTCEQTIKEIRKFGFRNKIFAFTKNWALIAHDSLIQSGASDVIKLPMSERELTVLLSENAEAMLTYNQVEKVSQEEVNHAITCTESAEDLITMMPSTDPVADAAPKEVKSDDAVIQKSDISNSEDVDGPSDSFGPYSTELSGKSLSGEFGSSNKLPILNTNTEDDEDILSPEDNNPEQDFQMQLSSTSDSMIPTSISIGTPNDPTQIDPTKLIVGGRKGLARKAPFLVVPYGASSTDSSDYRSMDRQLKVFSLTKDEFKKRTQRREKAMKWSYEQQKLKRKTARNAMKHHLSPSQSQYSMGSRASSRSSRSGSGSNLHQISSNGISLNSTVQATTSQTRTHHNNSGFSNRSKESFHSANSGRGKAALVEANGNFSPFVSKGSPGSRHALNASVQSIDVIYDDDDEANEENALEMESGDDLETKMNHLDDPLHSPNGELSDPMSSNESSGKLFAKKRVGLKNPKKKSFPMGRISSKTSEEYAGHLTEEEGGASGSQVGEDFEDDEDEGDDEDEDDDSDDLGVINEPLMLLDDDQVFADVFDQLITKKTNNEHDDLLEWNHIIVGKSLHNPLTALPDNVNSQLRISCSYSEKIGPRPYMEDRTYAKAIVSRSDPSKPSMGMFAVFDGHSGEYVATLLQSSFANKFCEFLDEYDSIRSNGSNGTKSLEVPNRSGQLIRANSSTVSDIRGVKSDSLAVIYELNIARIFEETVSYFDRSILEKDFQRQQKTLNTAGGNLNCQPFAGAVAVVMVALKSLTSEATQVFVAHVGDCRAVLSNDGKAIQLTDDHKASNQSERLRIEAAGGWVHPNGRVNGGLGVTRSIGDIQFKTYNGNVPHLRGEEESLEGIWARSQQVISKPDMKHFLVEPTFEFVILASDGLWDVFSSQEAVNFVRKQLMQHSDLGKAADELLEKAMARGSQDNTSVVICALNQNTFD